MWALDTSWLIAFFDSSDAFHKEARRQAGEAGPWLLNPVILAEFLEGIRRRGGKALSLQALHHLHSAPAVRWTQAPKPAQAARVIERSAGLSWQDATAIATALDEGAGLRTFDREQRKAFDALS